MGTPKWTIAAKLGPPQWSSTVPIISAIPSVDLRRGSLEKPKRTTY